MFEFLQMPFGLRNAGNTLQRLMDQVLGDLLISSSLAEIYPLMWTTSVKYFVSVGSMVKRLACLKFKFPISKIDFLRHLLSATGCSPLAKHSAAISAFPPPSDKPALQRFLGMLNF